MQPGNDQADESTKHPPTDEQPTKHPINEPITRSPEPTHLHHLQRVLVFAARSV